MSNMSNLNKIKLFNNLTEEDAEKFITCVKAKLVTLKKGERLFLAGDEPKNVALVLSGSLFVTQSDYMGNNSILSTVTENNLFGGGFAYSGVTRITVTVVAGCDSRVLLIDKDRLLSPCGNCLSHSKILINLIKILSARNVNLMEKIQNLSGRTIRQKILSLLYTFSLNSKNKRIILPYTRQQMSDYLCVDRSALSRELSALKKEGIIDYRKNEFIFLTDKAERYE